MDVELQDEETHTYAGQGFRTGKQSNQSATQE